MIQVAARQATINGESRVSEAALMAAGELGMNGNLSQTQSESNRYPSRWRILAASFFCYGFDAMDFMVLALSLALITQELHLSLGEAGLLGTAGMMGVGLSSVVVGWYSDNYGRKRALMYCVTMFGIFTAAIFWARGWWDMLALRFLAGLGLGGAWGVITAYIAETWPHATRGRAVSFVLSSWPIGYIVATLVARSVLPVYGWRVLFLIGGFALIAALWVWLFVPESAQWQEARAARRLKQDSNAGERVAIREIFAPELARHTTLGTLTAASALIGYWGANTWLPTYLVRERGLDQSSVAGFLVTLNVGMFVGYQVFGWLADRIGQRRTLLVCFSGAALLLPGYALMQNLNNLYWLGPLLGLFFASAGPMGAYFPALYPTRVRSLGAGFCFDVGRGIAALAPFAFGQLATRIGLGNSIAYCGCGFFLAALIMWWMPERA
jgi:MFS family permease